MVDSHAYSNKFVFKGVIFLICNVYYTIAFFLDNFVRSNIVNQPINVYPITFLIPGTNFWCWACHRVTL